MYGLHYSMCLSNESSLEWLTLEGDSPVRGGITQLKSVLSSAGWNSHVNMGVT